MAEDNKISFSFETLFSGEGATAANNAIRETGRTLNSAKNAAQPLINEMAKLPGVAGEIAGKLGSVASGFAQMGIAGAAISGVSIVIEGVRDKLTQMADELTALSNQMSFADAAEHQREMQLTLDAVTVSLGNVKVAAETSGAAFEGMAASAAKLSAAVAQLQGAEGAQTVSEVLIQNFNSVLEAESTAIANLTTAQNNVTAAITESEAARADAEAKLNSAKEAEAIAHQGVEVASQTYATASQALYEATEAEKNAKQRGAENIEQFTAARKTAEEAMVKADTELAKRVTAEQVASTNVETAQKQLQTTINTHNLAVSKASESFNAVSGRQQLLEQATTSFNVTMGQQKKILDDYDTAVNSGVSSAKALADAQSALAKIEKDANNQQAEVMRVQKTAQTTYEEAYNAYAKALADGYTGQEAYNKAISDCKAAAEKLAEAQTEAAADLTDGTSSAGDNDKVGSLTVEQLKLAVAGALGKTSVSINSDSLGTGLDHSNKLITQGQLMSEINSEAKAQREKVNDMNTTANTMKEYISGNMPADVAAKFIEKLVDKKFTPDEIDRLHREALDKQLLSKREAQEQKEAIDAIKEALEEVGLK